MSPLASVSAFLHSIIGASVFSRSSFTIPAVISAISSSYSAAAAVRGQPRCVSSGAHSSMPLRVARERGAR